MCAPTSKAKKSNLERPYPPLAVATASYPAAAPSPEISSSKKLSSGRQLWGFHIQHAVYDSQGQGRLLSCPDPGGVKQPDEES